LIFKSTFHKDGSIAISSITSSEVFLENPSANHKQCNKQKYFSNQYRTLGLVNKESEVMQLVKVF